MSEDIDLIVSMGYTLTEAKQALTENGGSVDDAIDYLFTSGRVAAIKTSGAVSFNKDDVTVTDSIQTRPSEAKDKATVSDSIPQSARKASTSRSNEASATNPTPSFSLMVGLRSNKQTKNGHAGEGALDEVNIESNKPKAANSSQAKQGTTSNTQAPTRTPSVLGAFAIGYRDDDEDDEILTDSVTQPVLDSENHILQQRLETSRPGAFAEGWGNDDDDGNEATVASSHQLFLVSAELVDPEKADRVLHERVRKELEAEEQNAELANIVSED